MTDQHPARVNFQLESSWPMFLKNILAVRKMLHILTEPKIPYIICFLDQNVTERDPERFHVGRQPEQHACDAVAYPVACRRSCLSKLPFHIGDETQAPLYPMVEGRKSRQFIFFGSDTHFNIYEEKMNSDETTYKMKMPSANCCQILSA